jgi:hypothetical protein
VCERDEDGEAPIWPLLWQQTRRCAFTYVAYDAHRHCQSLKMVCAFVQLRGSLSQAGDRQRVRQEPLLNGACDQTFFSRRESVQFPTPNADARVIFQTWSINRDNANVTTPRLPIVGRSVRHPEPGASMRIVRDVASPRQICGIRRRAILKRERRISGHGRTRHRPEMLPFGRVHLKLHVHLQHETTCMRPINSASLRR